MESSSARHVNRRVVSHDPVQIEWTEFKYGSYFSQTVNKL